MQRFYVETLGCPKNDVDSDKLVGALVADGMEATDDASAADLVVVNTSAFIGEARQESIDTILALDERAAAATVDSSSPGAWPSGTVPNWPRRFPKSIRWPGSDRRSTSCPRSATAPRSLREWPPLAS